MKPKKVKAVLQARIKAWESLRDKTGFKKPGSQKSK